MAITFTEKQQQVIDTHGCNLLVSAAAGSGKTAVLVERIVKMVSDAKNPVDIDRLLVVTFTNAAASEMRERISRAIGERLAETPENEHLQRQEALLHNAQITTIDSFCLFVIRNQFHTIGLDLGFRIADEGELKLLRADVMAQVLEQGYLEENPQFLDCMEYFSLGSRDEEAEDVVLRLYDFAMSNPFPEEWLSARKLDYVVPEGVPFEKLPWVQELFRQARLFVQGCASYLEEAIHICDQPDGPYPYGALLEQEKEMTQRLLQACGASNFDALCAAFGAVHFDRLPSKKDDTISGEKRELVKSIREKVKKILGRLQKDYFSQTKEQVLKQMETCGYAVDALVDLTLAFKKMFDEKKRDKNILDFDDVEHFALSILVKRGEDGACQPTDTALEYRSHFHEILIDEYQDSNLVQEYLLACISGEDEGRYNRFMVGDVKQSIYKFRLARPELFLEKYEEYGQAEQRIETGQANEREPLQADGGRQMQQQSEMGRPTAMKIDLHQNFRSRGEVLNSVNSVFEQIMGREIGGIVYDEQAALHPGASYPASFWHTKNMKTCRPLGGDDVQTEDAASPNDTELLIFDAGEKPEEISAKEQEAHGVALKIKQLMREFQVTERGRDGDSLRKLSYKDIVILLRTVSGWDDVFKRVLEEEGIPVHMISRTGYFAASEVQELLHFLRILDNPLQDIPFYGVLHSVLGGFTEEEIALIRAAYPKKKYLYDAFVLCGESDDNTKLTDTVNRNKNTMNAERKDPATAIIDDTLRGKIRKFHEDLCVFRELADYLSVHELLQEILRRTDYLNYVSARPEGERRRANVEMLLNKAAEYEKTSYYGLYHFLRYMEQLEKYEVDYGEAGIQDENADVVRIMSIHKSKGLEFPVCFVCGLAKGFQTKDASAHMVADVDAGIGVDYVNPAWRVRGKSLRQNVIADKLRRDSLAEEMRILYVAMTRAKEKLILTGSLKAPDKAAASLMLLWRRKEKELPFETLMTSGSFLDLILAALARNKCMDEFYAACGLSVGWEDAERSCPGSRNESRSRTCPLYDKDINIQISLTDWEEAVEDEIEETVRKEERKRRLLVSDCKKDVDESLMEYMEEKFSYRYPHENLKNLYTKTTVSELKKAGMQEETDFSFKLYEEEPIVPYLPKFIQTDSGVSGSMRGSAFHKAMELFDFTELTDKVNRDADALRKMITAQLARMRKEGGLSEEYYNAVSLPKLVTFMQSDAALRMADAARAGKLHKEQPFVLGLPASRLNAEFPETETVLVQGIIDVFFEEGDSYVVLDYKTDAVDAPEELVRRYQVQLAYYAEALEQLCAHEKSVKEKIIYSFKLGYEIKI